MNLQKINQYVCISIMLVIAVSFLSVYECHAQEIKEDESSQTNNNQQGSIERGENSGNFEEFKKVCSDKINTYNNHITSMKKQEKFKEEIPALEEKITNLRLVIQRYDAKTDTNWTDFKKNAMKEIELIEKTFYELTGNTKQN